MPTLSVTFYPSPGAIGAESHVFTLQSALSPFAWRVEPFQPGRRLGDAWCASSAVGSGWAVELELSTRRGFYCDRVEVIGPSGLSRTIPVKMAWPAGRALALRLGADVPLHPSWRRRRERFGPLDMPLPTIADEAFQEQQARAKLSELRAAISARGSCTIEDSEDGLFVDGDSAPWIGPFPRWGRQDPGPGDPGGSGIAHSTGWQGTPGFAALACEAEALAISRMWACYRASDGAPLSVDDFPGISPNVVSQQGIKPPGFDGPDPLPLPFSVSHYSRVLRWCIAAWELTGSPMAARHILLLAEQMRLQWSERGVVATGDAGWTAENLATWKVIASQRAGQGFAWNRTHGWAAWSAAMAKKVGHWSPGWQAWSNALLGGLATSAMPTGMVARVPAQVAANALPAGNDVTQAFHEAIVGIGALALGYRTGMPVPNWIVLAARSLYQSMPLGPYGGQVGPLHYPIVAPSGGAPVPKLTEGYGHPDTPSEPGDPAHVETYLAALWKATGQADYLDWSLRVGVPASSRAEKLAKLSAASDPMARNWQAFLLGALQRAA